MANWGKLKEELDSCYRIQLECDERTIPNFARFRDRLPLSMKRLLPFDFCLTYIDGVVVMSVDVGDDLKKMKDHRPYLLETIKQSLAKSEKKEYLIDGNLIVVFFDKSEKDLADEAVKPYLV